MGNRKGSAIDGKETHWCERLGRESRASRRAMRVQRGPDSSLARSQRAGPVKKPLFKKPAAPHTTAPETAGVAAGNGKDRRRKKEDEFEEV